MARKILVLDWKGPGDKNSLVPRVVPADDNRVDGFDVTGCGDVEMRRIYSRIDYVHGKHVSHFWYLVVSRQKRARGILHITKPYVDKLTCEAHGASRVMVICIGTYGIPQEGLMLDRIPETQYNKYLAPLVCGDIDVKIAMMQIRDELPYRGGSIVSEADLAVLRRLYNDVVLDDETCALIQELYKNFLDNTTAGYDEYIHFYKTVIKSQPHVYQKYLAAVTVPARDEVDIDFD